MERAFFLVFVLAFGSLVNFTYAQETQPKGQAYLIELSASVGNVIAKQVVSFLNTTDPAGKADFQRDQRTLVISPMHRSSIADILDTLEDFGLHVEKIDLIPAHSGSHSWNVSVSRAGQSDDQE